MKVTLFNDTHGEWRLHPGSLRGVDDANLIPPQRMLAFEVPDGRDVFVKVWETGMVLVRPFRHSPRQNELPFGD